MEKITKGHVTNQLHRLNSALGTDYKLDHIASYGGYKVVEVGENGGERDIFGAERRRAREMYDTINFALRAIQIDRVGADTTSYWPDNK